MNVRILILASLSSLTLAGCATTSGVVVNPSAKKANYATATLIVHGGRSSDMDANLQRSLLANGLSVNISPEVHPAESADLLIRYADEWKWDLSMYLRSFDLMIYDAKTNVLLASANWKNSAMHGFHDERKVVDDAVRDTMAKLKGPP